MLGLFPVDQVTLIQCVEDELANKFRVIIDSNPHRKEAYSTLKVPNPITSSWSINYDMSV